MSPRYQEWLKFVFDRPVTSNGWYFDMDFPDFEAEDTELVKLITNTMENCGQDLAGYSEGQIRYGLDYIFNNSCSDVVFSLMNDAVPVPLRLHALASIKALYRDCFTPRCAPVLGHTSEPRANPLNYICYMLWDMSPISYWERSKDKDAFYRAVVDVMAEALISPNPACVESGLHGLGHVQSSFPHAGDVVAAYLDRNVLASSALRSYAQQARVGNVQ